MPKMNVIPTKGLVQSPGSGFLIDGTAVASSAQSLDQLIFLLNNTYTPEILRQEDEQIIWFLG